MTDPRDEEEDKLLRSVALQNAQTILLARQRAEEELVRAKEALELKTKYTDRGGRIGLTVEPAGDEVMIRVTDSGIGIPPEMLRRVFEMFTQVDRSLERSEGGLGIGLTLVQRLVELHGGTVEAHSEGTGKGSEFVVRLPVARQDGRSVQAPGAGGENLTAGSSRRILVVDD